jgi:glycerol-3-phosphate dehydrogenase
VLAAEVLFALREEMAGNLADLVRRRTDLGNAGPPDGGALDAAGRLAAREMGWDEARMQREQDAVRDLYRWR